MVLYHIFIPAPSECSALFPLTLAALSDSCSGRREAALRTPFLFSPRVGKHTVSSLSLWFFAILLCSGLCWCLLRIVLDKKIYFGREV